MVCSMELSHYLLELVRYVRETYLYEPSATMTIIHVGLDYYCREPILKLFKRNKSHGVGAMHLNEIMKTNYRQLRYHACSVLRMCSKTGRFRSFD